ncbi:MAG: adenylate/guanylate cyclase domain-containing protein [Gammaproteobacteria bacterium]|nr:adenylate/guanylate cyclase domain-containing protein [Gammaproteobacteria bacterium]
MALTRRTRRSLCIWSISTLVGGAIGVMYSLFVGGQPKFAFPIGCAIVGGVMGFELLFVQQPVGAWLRGLPLLAFITISTLLWTVIIAVSLQIVPRLLGDEEAYGRHYHATTFQQDMVFSLAVAFAMNTVLRIRSLVGGRVLMNFLVGRYHRPLREQRVFLFLDLADSTSLSEELGDVRVQSLIGRFFFDIAQPIAEHGGETHRYIGDEIVVTWPFLVATKDARCLECVFDIQELIAAQSRRYEADFGVVPRFRAGMHGGPVVASEVGDDKREIVYFGDSINTAARLQSLCKEKARDFLVSGDLLAAMTLPPETKTQYMGETALRGKAKSLDVYALSRGSRNT